MTEHKPAVYERLGANWVINCLDTFTLLGGHTIPPEVREAMTQADESFAWIWDLEQLAGERISELTGAEAAFVTPGAFSGLSMGLAAIMAGTNPEQMRRLPDTTGMRDEVVIQRPLRDYQYDRSMTAVGGTLVEVGISHHRCDAQHIEDAINENTAAIHHMAHGPTDVPDRDSYQWVPVEEVIEIGEAHDVPVIVDAAFQCHPTDHLSRFTDLGADLVGYSCKYFGGPNTAGLLLGREDLIDAVARHSFIGQEGADRGKDLISVTEKGYYRSMFRGHKLDRSSIVGAVVALERYIQLMDDIDAALAEQRTHLEELRDGLDEVDGISMEAREGGPEGGTPLRLDLVIHLDDRTSEEASAIARQLREGNPEIWLDNDGAALVVTVSGFRGLPTMQTHEIPIVAQRLQEEL